MIIIVADSAALPTNFTVYQSKDTTVHFKWNNPKNAVASAYAVKATISNTNATEDFYNILYSSSLPAVGLTPGRNYHFELIPLNVSNADYEMHADVKTSELSGKKYFFK